MNKQQVASLNVHTVDYESVLHEASGETVSMAMLSGLDDAHASVSVARASVNGAKYRAPQNPEGSGLAFYVISGRVSWRPDVGEPVEWGPGDLVLVSDASGELEYTPDHVCVLFTWRDGEVS
jgi:hypothetical protein